jgi:surfeit locus 1 family protein
VTDEVERAAPRSLRARLAIGLLSLVGVAVLIALGLWQLDRLNWKLHLIAAVDARVHAAATPAPGRDAWAALTRDGDEYRHVAVSGHFLNKDETLVQAVSEKGAGFWVLTPLVADDGFTVLVNRGFVPSERRDAATRPASLVEGAVRVAGLLRITEPGGGFLRANDPGTGHWYSRDVAAIAAAHGLTNVAPYFIDADATPNPGGLPIGGLTVIDFPNNHLVYALTWFALAIMLAGLAAYILLGERKRRQRSALADVQP